jgi:hypothetical protein
MTSQKQLPEFVLFGDSLTEWSFSETTQGFGLFLEGKYAGKATMVNEGKSLIVFRYCSPCARSSERFVLLPSACLLNHQCCQHVKYSNALSKSV